MTTITIDRAVVEQALEAMQIAAAELDSPYTSETPEERVLRAAITALKAALAQEQPNPPGCDHCNHPLYAATKCRVCGRVTEQAEPAYKTYPISMHFEWVGDRWLFDGNPIDSGEWSITLGDGGWMIYPKVEQAEPVAWIQPRTLDGHLRPDLGYETCSESDYGAFPVYTAPQKLVPLTQEEIIDATEHIDTSRDGYFIDIARATERALEEKNRGR